MPCRSCLGDKDVYAASWVREDRPRLIRVAKIRYKSVSISKTRVEGA